MKFECHGCGKELTQAEIRVWLWCDRTARNEPHCSYECRQPFTPCIHEQAPPRVAK